MNRSDLAKALVHEAPGLSAADAEKILAALPKVMHAELQTKGEAVLHGMGSFRVHETKARKGRNPATGAEIDIPAGKRIAFKVGAALKSGL
ncbi:HU family DNA-binding protein [Methylobacterium thuringiense]|uniref:DNA-binding protein HRL53 n=1 Tax=Methylobacterium thuringiense TaxID=1003091 RepID=A0ABQ4TL70_9HYPH|nr:HU family DNA-binding protein [Methylobacterium thuringiense]GJE54563.1 DNA-binding protein HRL53 [Methylobacterium thuringiense]